MTGDAVEPTERGRIQALIDNAIALPRIGRVTAVRTHTDTSDTSNHEVDVAVPPGDPVQEFRTVPILQPTGASVALPQEGDLVRVNFLDGDGDRPIVDGVVYADADRDRAPLADAGDVRVSRGDLYAELAGDGSVARLAKKPGDLDTPTATVSIDAQGAVTIKTDGDITVSAGGDVVIDEGGTAAPVAVQGHDHDFSGTTSDGASFSGTTTQPNQSGTNAEIE